MTAKLSVLFFVVCCSVFGQVDASWFRAKYGEPLSRETFQVRPNIEAVVSYGTARQVCKIELPPGRLAVLTTQQFDEILNELVPLSVRGKNINSLIAGSGRIFAAIADYEFVSITEPQESDHPGRRISVTISFKRPDCH